VDSVGLARVVALSFVAAAVFGAPGAALGAEPLALTVVADRDDDDVDGRPDCEEDPVPPAARVDLVPLDKSLLGATLHAISGGEHARVIVDGRPVAWGRPLVAQAWIQGISPGTVSLVASLPGREIAVAIRVRGVGMRDENGAAVDMARSHASLERTPPARVEPDVDAHYDDEDALEVLLQTQGPSEPADVSLDSLSSLGVRLDVLAHVPFSPSSCKPAADGLRCWASAPIRFVIDDVDRSHPLVAQRSLKAEVGGAIVVRLDGKKGQLIRVAGPRTSPVGPIPRMRATVRPFVLRVSPGGAPAIGGSDAGAVAAVRAELAVASAIWGQCGLTFGDPRTLEVKIVDPPPPHLLAIGDDAGLVASGGEIRVRADAHMITVPVPSGASCDRVAFDVARAVEKAGLVAIVSPNARISPGAAGSVDISVRHKDGSFATLDAVSPGAPVSSDETLSVRIGSVDLSDGLQHFTDMDAMAGTLEERTLLKALDDGDPQSIEVVVVPLFSGGGRIGESFIGSDLSSLRNVVLLDRAGIRARKSSLTLAHELGHVFMDIPGHPDDYGVDTPVLLMDSDASDASPFGPRRISVDECARVVRQAGPKARVPLLTEWPLAPLPSEGKAPPH
jgi:hypothetical protein